MKVRILIYDKETDSFSSDFIQFKWINLKNKSAIEIIEANRYLYYRKIKEYYKNNKVPYADYLYDSFYEDQFNNLIP